MLTTRGTIILVIICGGILLLAFSNIHRASDANSMQAIHEELERNRRNAQLESAMQPMQPLRSDSEGGKMLQQPALNFDGALEQSNAEQQQQQQQQLNRRQGESAKSPAKLTNNRLPRKRRPSLRKPERSGLAEEPQGQQQVPAPQQKPSPTDKANGDAQRRKHKQQKKER